MSDSQTRFSYDPDFVSPPGGSLEDLLEEREMTQAELATRTGLSKKTVNEIINGKAAISADSAQKLELALGVPSSFWLSRETQYRDHIAKRDENKRLVDDVGWIEQLPVRELAKRGWIEKTKTPVEKVRQCLGFFGVASVAQWQEVYAAPQAAFRKSTKFKVDPGALAAWMRVGEILGGRVRCDPYDRSTFLDVLEQARGLSRKPVPQAFEALAGLCASAGVALVLVPQIKGCRASGVARWLSKDRALIQLSLRYRADDHLWFSFFHEAAHIVLHPKKAVFLEGSSEHDGQLEDEANEFARNMLIPFSEYRRFAASGPPFSAASVESFARRIGVAPGVVVGRLQFERLLPHSHLNKLKVKVDWGQ